MLCTFYIACLLSQPGLDVPPPPPSEWRYEVYMTVAPDPVRMSSLALRLSSARGRFAPGDDWAVAGRVAAEPASPHVIAALNALAGAGFAYRPLQSLLFRVDYRYRGHCDGRIESALDLAMALLF